MYITMSKLAPLALAILAVSIFTTLNVAEAATVGPRSDDFSSNTTATVDSAAMDTTTTTFTTASPTPVTCMALAMDVANVHETRDINIVYGIAKPKTFDSQEEGYKASEWQAIEACNYNANSALSDLTATPDCKAVYSFCQDTTAQTNGGCVAVAWSYDWQQWFASGMHAAYPASLAATKALNACNQWLCQDDPLRSWDSECQAAESVCYVDFLMCTDGSLQKAVFDFENLPSLGYIEQDLIDGSITGLGNLTLEQKEKSIMYALLPFKELPYESHLYTTYSWEFM